MFYFAFPMFLAGVALVTVPLLLHFLRKRMRKTQEFPSFYFLKQMIARKRSRNDFRSWLVLLLRILVLACLALAFAWPCFDQPDKEPEEATVFILDGSYSTRNPEFQSSLDGILETQLKNISTDRPAVGLIASDRMTVSGDFTSDSGSLKSFFRHYKGEVPVSCDFSLALYRADRILAGIKAEKRRIVVLTDRQRVPWRHLPEEPFLTTADEVTIVPEAVSEPVNARIISAERTGGGLQVSLLCTGGKEQGIGCELELLSEKGQSLWKQPAALTCGSSIHVVIPLSGKIGNDEAGMLRLHCKNDAYPADNEWYFPPVPKVKRAVQLFSSVRYPALNAALDSAEIRFTESEEWPDVLPDMFMVGDSPLSEPRMVCGKLDDALHAGSAVVLLYENTPFMQSLFEHFGAAFMEGDKRAASLTLESLNLEHPVFQEYRNLGSASWFDLLFFDVPTIRYPEGTQVLATFEGGLPAIAEFPYNGGKVFFFAFSPDSKRTNFQTSGHFLPFVRELLEYSALAARKKVMFTAADKTVRMAEGELDLRKPGIRHLGEETICINADRMESETELLPNGFTVPESVKKSGEDVTVKKKEFPFDKTNPLILFACALVFLLAELGISNRTAL